MQIVISNTSVCFTFHENTHKNQTKTNTHTHKKSPSVSGPTRAMSSRSNASLGNNRQRSLSKLETTRAIRDSRNRQSTCTLASRYSACLDGPQSLLAALRWRSSLEAGHRHKVLQIHSTETRLCRPTAWNIVRAAFCVVLSMHLLLLHFSFYAYLFIYGGGGGREGEGERVHGSSLSLIGMLFPPDAWKF